MQISKIVIGGMRFRDRQSAADVIHAAIDAGFNYIDTSPAYCRQSEEENSEAWVGAALQDARYRERVYVSTKCTAGDGGLGIGEFRPEGGFGVRSKAQLQQVFEQSLRRLQMDRVDFYHLWTTHTQAQLDEAMKPGGWFEGVMEQKDQQRFKHLGITSHATSNTLLDFLGTGRFETLTIPLNIVNLTRRNMVDYGAEHNIPIIAMNPLAGGFLAVHDELKELALRLLLMLPNVHALIGFSAVSEVTYAKEILDSMPSYDGSIDDIMKRVDELIGADTPRCTACGYCSPCPQDINLGACLSYYNLYKYMNMAQARKAFLDKQWESGLRLDKCTSCGHCKASCPNSLPLDDIIADAQKLMYAEKA